MDAKLKADWVKALRSGEYEQARHSLKDGKGLCCIGVGYVVLRGRRPSFTATAPASKAIGLSDDQSKKLVDLNDQKNFGFRRIANWIEKNL